MTIDVVDRSEVDGRDKETDDSDNTVSTGVDEKQNDGLAHRNLPTHSIENLADDSVDNIFGELSVTQSNDTLNDIESLMPGPENIYDFTLQKPSSTNFVSLFCPCSQSLISLLIEVTLSSVFDIRSTTWIIY